MNNLIVWDPDYNIDARLSKLYYNINWFEHCDVFSGTDYHETVRNSSSKKIVLLDWWQYATGAIKRTLNVNDLSWADLIICFSTEYIHEPWDHYYEYTKDYFKNENIIFIYGGNLLNNPSKNELIFYPNLSFLLKVFAANDPYSYDFTSPRPYMFDALLGGKKWYRVLLFKELAAANLLDKSLINIEDNEFVKSNEIPNYRSPGLRKLEHEVIAKFRQEQENKNEYKTSVKPVDRLYRGIPYGRVWGSQIIPQYIYANTWYSIISETEIDRAEFITEKTAKCFFAKRIFVSNAAPGHLKLLRSLGFKTFNGLIDESYDDEPIYDVRLQKIKEQIVFLSESNPVNLYQDAMPILEHNFNLITDMSWHMIKIKNFIKTHLDRLK